MSEPLACAVHPDLPAEGRCRRCGQPLCAACQTTREGVILCRSCQGERRLRRVKILAVVTLMVGAPGALAAWMVSERLSGRSGPAGTKKKIRPESGDAHRARLRRAEHLARTGRAAEARAEIARVLKAEPLHPGALHALARLDRAAGDWAAVEQTATRILAQHPGAVEARQWQAEALLSQGRPGDAERTLREGLGKVPRSGALALALAKLYSVTGRRQEALELLREVIKRRPDAEVDALHALLLSLEKDPK